MRLALRNASGGQICPSISVLIFLAILTSPLHAQNNSWTNTGNGFWQDGTNWSLGAPASTQSGIFISNANTKTVTIDATTTTFPGTMTISNLTVTAPVGSINTLNLSGAGLSVPLHIIRSLATLTNSALIIDNSALIMDGATGGSFTNNGRVTVQNGGLLVTTNSRVGTVASSIGTLTVTDSTFTNLGAMIVGSGARGEIAFTNSSTFFGGVVTVGSGANGNGKMTIFGGTNVYKTGAAITVLNIGNGGATTTGMVLITGGALVSFTNTVGQSLFVASGGNSVGELTVSNATVVGPIISIGNNSGVRGTFTVGPGAEILLPTANSVLRIGDNQGSTGYVNVAGGNITIQETIQVGRAGFGQMIVSNGIVRTTHSVNGTLVLGLDVAPRGLGIYRMVGGTTDVAAAMTLGSTVGSTGIVEMAGGFMRVGGTTQLGVTTNSFGKIDVSNGTLALATTLVGVSAASSARGEVIISGGQLSVTNASKSAVLDVRQGLLRLDGGTTTVNRLVVTNSAGTFEFNSGTLNVNTSIVANGLAVVVGNGISPAALNLLGGTHSFSNGLTLNTNAALDGAGFSTMTLGGNLLLVLNSNFIVDLSTNSATPGTGYDRAFVTGTVTVAESILTVNTTNFTAQQNAVFTIIDNDAADSVFGTFAGLANGSEFSSGGGQFKINYFGGTGNDVVLIVVPEPSALTFLAIGSLFFLLRSRRDQK